MTDDGYPTRKNDDSGAFLFLRITDLVNYLVKDKNHNNDTSNVSVVCGGNWQS